LRSRAVNPKLASGQKTVRQGECAFVTSSLAAESLQENAFVYGGLASGRSFYNWNRHYSPVLGRYITSDPIGLASGLNPFSYVNNRPLNLIDPTGLFGVAVPGPIAPPVAGPTSPGGNAGNGDDGFWDEPASSPMTGSQLMQEISNAISSAVGAITPKQCKDDDDSCDIVLDKGQLKRAGIRGREHEVKAGELGTNKNLSKFDLCGCKDGRVVVKAHGCKGPIISDTGYRWK